MNALHGLLNCEVGG